MATVKALADTELVQVIFWAEDERRVRADKRKDDTIAKIEEMVGAAGISVSIHANRGRRRASRKLYRRRLKRGSDLPATLRLFALLVYPVRGESFGYSAVATDATRIYSQRLSLSFTNSLFTIGATISLRVSSDRLRQQKCGRGACLAFCSETA